MSTKHFFLLILQYYTCNFLIKKVIIVTQKGSTNYRIYLILKFNVLYLILLNRMIFYINSKWLLEEPVVIWKFGREPVSLFVPVVKMKIRNSLVFIWTQIVLYWTWPCEKKLCWILYHTGEMRLHIKPFDICVKVLVVKNVT
jgi:hypothetical protein